MDVRDVPIPRPCPARWERMAGDERHRWCRECRTEVHDLTAMTASESQAFVAAHPTACLRYSYDRRTGAILHRGAGCGAARVRIARRRLGGIAALGLALSAPAWAGSAIAPGVADRLWERVAELGVWLGLVDPPVVEILEERMGVMLILEPPEPEVSGT